MSYSTLRLRIESWERHALKIEGGADLQVFSVWSV